jgi:hypothetical protein
MRALDETQLDAKRLEFLWTSELERVRLQHVSLDHSIFGTQRVMLLTFLAPAVTLLQD